ncbi:MULTISPECIES: M15 family metallopeptidase [Actinoalloteichus]|uniref:D-alanyl-D-alanine carboxypeptidase n=1 Tax=Actinoalloteichus fjordicus TaxID=1612552 RepID=A0AAC9PTQ2_9PSEU|nr:MULTISPECIES: M15 family metallopeptidase [Actinoalloteichus]APU16131.1 D-alanyl-D-alanine carboxypeptidase [Actinoalloteichus fjordicus]APU22194.1 D-alanyl-D-alanine carboxypeptidase [Actinoalloteichus sp. GBA129-24]
MTSVNARPWQAFSKDAQVRQHDLHVITGWSRKDNVSGVNGVLPDVKKTTHRVTLALAALGMAAATALPASAAEPAETTNWVGESVVVSIKPVSEERLGASYREGCPVGPEDLRLVSFPHLGFDDRTHRGELIVHADVAEEVLGIFIDLYRGGFPIERVETVEKYDADDDLSMAANNTSAFNCRPITGGGGWSNHSYGKAIDINPVQNPYVSSSGLVLPPTGAPYVDRDQDAPGMIYAGDLVEQSFTENGWEWGGFWTTPLDYQHFEKP